MRPCKEIVELLSLQGESGHDLSWLERAEIRIHLMMCKHCSRYATHLGMMRDGFKKLFAKITQVNKAQVIQLESEVLERMKKKGLR